jgi:hypothetical protein
MAGLQPALRVAKDQPAKWRNFEKPIALDAAAGMVRAAHGADGERDDVEIPDLRAWAVIPDGTTLALAPLPFPGVRARGPFPLRENAFRQLCGRMGAPSDYLLGLPAKLQLACANYGMSRLGDRAGLVRLAGTEARAIVSDRYAKLDDEVVLEALYDTLGRLGLAQSIRVRAVATGSMTALRMTFPTEAVELKQSKTVGDIFEYGLDITNGELGARSVGITSATYRLVCLNGMRSWKSEANMRFRHVGDTGRLREAFIDGVPIAVAEARGQIEQWKRSVEMIVSDVFEEIEALRTFGMSAADTRAVATTFATENGLYLPAKASAENVSDLLRSAGDPTVFNIANAITRTAQAHAENPERRFEMEEVGHRYLTRRVGAVAAID